MALGSDNTAVMSGHKKGVHGRAKADHPHINFSGCINHLYDVAGKRGMAELPVDIEDFVVNVYYYLKNSDVRTLEFRAVQVRFSALFIYFTLWLLHSMAVFDSLF